MTTTTETEPQAWVGCLACYNDGRLTGDWLNGPAALEWECPRSSHHEEYWCFDMQGVPKPQEMSPMEFAALAQFIDEILDDNRAAVFAYINNAGISWRDFDPHDFDDAYCGEWESEKDYAYQLADDMGFEEPTSWPGQYIDWEAATRDLFMSDNYSLPNPEGGIFVFRNF